jgi:short-subunit dehydrogenase
MRCTPRRKRVDLLVNNAGVGLAARFLETELERPLGKAALSGVRKLL